MCSDESCFGDVMCSHESGFCDVMCSDESDACDVMCADEFGFCDVIGSVESGVCDVMCSDDSGFCDVMYADESGFCDVMCSDEPCFVMRCIQMSQVFVMLMCLGGFFGEALNNFSSGEARGDALLLRLAGSSQAGRSATLNGRARSCPQHPGCRYS